MKAKDWASLAAAGLLLAGCASAPRTPIVIEAPAPEQTPNVMRVRGTVLPVDPSIKLETAFAEFRRHDHPVRLHGRGRQARCRPSVHLHLDERRRIRRREPARPRRRRGLEERLLERAAFLRRVRGRTYRRPFASARSATFETTSAMPIACTAPIRSPRSTIEKKKAESGSRQLSSPATTGEIHLRPLR